MRILYHHRTRAEDAQGVHIYEMVNAFRQLGHEVKIVSIVREGHIKEKESESWISRFAARLPPMGYELLEIFYNLYGFLRLIKEVIRFHPDLIYERYSLYNVAGILVSKFYEIPLLLEVNSPLYLEKEKYGNLAFRSLARIFERWICSNSYKTVVVSTPLKNILRSIGVPGDHMVVIPNGINPGLFNRDQIKTDIRNQLGLDNKIVLGFVGWFRKWHGLEDLLRIYVDYGMKEKNIHLLLIGDGPAYKDLELFARQNEIMGTGVTFTGNLKREKVPEYIASFDLAIQPDVTDYASPIKVFEYMAMGKGVIAPDKENIKEIVKSDYPGLFEAGDWKDMARTILKYAQSKEKTRELGEQAKNILNEEKYFWVDNARKTLALLGE
jgi:glycosyltransferase involved in cell wall biosynthesis